jgi:hypothetical protein
MPHQAQTGTPAPPAVDPTMAYRFEDLTMEIQWKGAVAMAVMIFLVTVVVCIRDLFGLFDFGTLQEAFWLCPESYLTR